MSEHTKGELHRHDSDIHIQRTAPDGSVVEHSCIAIANDVLPNFAANAEEIVRRWNSQPDLLKACEKSDNLLNLCAKVFLNTGEPPEPEEMANTICDIKAALAKAQPSSTSVE